MGGGCCETAEREMNEWISKDKLYTNQKGVCGNLGELEGAERWTQTSEDCLNIDDIEGIDTREELIDSEIGIGAKTEVNEEKEDDKMDVQVSAGELGGQNHAVLDEPVEIPASSIDLK